MPFDIPDDETERIPYTVYVLMRHFVYEFSEALGVYTDEKSAQAIVDKLDKENNKAYISHC